MRTKRLRFISFPGYQPQCSIPPPAGLEWLVILLLFFNLQEKLKLIVKFQTSLLEHKLVHNSFNMTNTKVI